MLLERSADWLELLSVAGVAAALLPLSVEDAWIAVLVPDPEDPVRPISLETWLEAAPEAAEVWAGVATAEVASVAAGAEMMLLRPTKRPPEELLVVDSEVGDGAGDSGTEFVFEA